MADYDRVLARLPRDVEAILGRGGRSCDATGSRLGMLARPDDLG